MGVRHPSLHLVACRDQVEVEYLAQDFSDAHCSQLTRSSSGHLEVQLSSSVIFRFAVIRPDKMQGSRWNGIWLTDRAQVNLEELQWLKREEARMGFRVGRYGSPEWQHFLIIGQCPTDTSVVGNLYSALCKMRVSLASV